MRTLCWFLLSSPALAGTPAWEAPKPYSIEGPHPYGVGFSRDGERLLLGGARSIQARNLPSGEPRFSQAHTGSFARSLAPFHHSDRFAVTTDKEGVFVLDDRTGQVVHHWTLGPSPTGSCALPEGEKDPSSQLSFERRWCHVDVEWMLDVAVSPDDRWVAAVGVQGSLAVWDTRTGERMALDPDRSRPNRLEGVDFSPDGRFLVAAGSFEQGAVQALDLSSGRTWMLPENEPPPEQWAMDVRFSPDGRHVAIGSFGGGVEVRSFPEGLLEWSHGDGTRDFSWPLAWSRDGESVFVTLPPRLLRLDARSGAVKAEATVHQLDAMALSPGGEVLAVTVRSAGLVFLDPKTLAPVRSPVFPTP